MDELVSVVVPVYNVEKYVSKCIESILNQTYKRLEIIVIEDNSTDNSRKICREIAKKDNRINYMENESNRGQSMTRNRGIWATTGKYCLFVDSDDYIDCNMVSEMVANAEAHSADLVECGHCLVDEFNIKLKKIVKDSRTYSSMDTEFLRKHFEGTLVSSSACAKLYKSEIVKKLAFVEGRYQEDAMFIPHVLLYCKTILIISNIFYYYVQTKESIMRGGITLKKIEDSIYSGEYLLDFCNIYAENLKPLISIRFCFYSALNYYYLQTSNLLGKSELQKKMSDIFSQHYKILKKSGMIKFVGKKYQYTFFVFSFSKRLCCQCMKLFRR